MNGNKLKRALQASAALHNMHFKKIRKKETNCESLDGSSCWKPSPSTKNSWNWEGMGGMSGNGGEGRTGERRVRRGGGGEGRGGEKRGEGEEA